MKVKLDSVTVGKRRREDMGDLKKLMVSIQQYGVWHPIVVTDDRTLVAGQRRLESCRRLGHKMIEVKFMGDLSENELREIELEENLLRKDLTAAERSRVMVGLVEAAKEAAAEEVLPESGKTSKGGRPTSGKASQESASERTGIPQQTISDAERHVAACGSYPFLKNARWKQKPALEMAALLDSLSESDVGFLLGYTHNGTGGNPKVIRQFFETWKESPPQKKRNIRSRLKGPNSGRVVSLLAGVAPSADASLVWFKETRRSLKRLIKIRPIDSFKGDLERLDEVLMKMENKAKKCNQKQIEALRSEVLS